MIIFIGLIFIVLSIRGILRQEFEFNNGRGSKIMILKGKSAVITGLVVLVGSSLMTLPYVLSAISGISADAYIALVFIGVGIIIMGFIIGWIMYQFAHSA